jgi:hypothetical protein
VTKAQQRYSAEALRRAAAEHREHARSGQYPLDLRVWARQSQAIAEQAAHDAERLEQSPPAPDALREALRLAREAVNSWACVARSNREHDTIARLHREIDALATSPAPAQTENCAWSEDENGAWHTDCGGTWEFTNDGPFENNVQHCFRCGRAVETFVHESPRP